MPKFKLCLLGLVAIATCACAKIPLGVERSFPPGTYHHKVTVEIPAQPTLYLQGVVKTAEEEWQLTALSPAGTTVFRLHENLKDETKEIETFQSEADLQKIRQLSAWLRRALFARRSREEFHFEGAEFSLSEPDEKSIPRKIQIEHPRVKITVEVVDYQVP